MERRHATILAADAVGYSRGMDQDERRAFAELILSRKIIDPIIERRHGRIFGSAGDSVIAEFNSSVNAVECAIEIQTELEDCRRSTAGTGVLPFRVGINFGDVIVDGENLIGDGVNVAARLEAIAPAGGICVSSNVMDQVAGKTEASFGDAGEHRMKNIQKPVRVWCWPSVAAPALGRASIGGRRRRWLPFLGGAAVLTALLAYVLFHDAREGPERPHKVSLAVMPFDNIGGEQSQDYFVDGITSDLITDLSKVSGLFVIARNSTFAYKGQPITPDRIKDELGVRYVLEGSVRASGGRLRINSQLIDAATGGQIWADRFDRELGDVFALQDDVTREIVSALKVELSPDEEASILRMSQTTPSDAYDHFLKGLSEIRRYTPATTRSARLSLLRALAIDPDYARAHAALAFSYVSNAIFFVEGREEAAFLSALYYARRAIQIDPALPQAHLALALTYQRLGRPEDALAAAKASVRHDPNYADGYAALSAIQAYAGDGKAAEDNIRQAMALNPHFSSAYSELLGRAKVVQHRFEDALGFFRDCLERDSERLTCRVYLAAILGVLGQTENAHWEAQEILVRKPDFTVEDNIIITQFEQQENRDLLEGGLQAAGLPER